MMLKITMSMIKWLLANMIRDSYDWEYGEGESTWRTLKDCNRWGQERLRM